MLFSIDILFKGSQSLLNVKSKVTAVSLILHAYQSSDNDTAMIVYITAVLMTPMCRVQPSHIST
jgi:hypothetical protein